MFRKNINDVLIGSLLGDGCIVRSGRGRNQFRFKQSIRNIDYFYFMFFIFEPYLTKGSPIFEKYLDSRYNKYYESLLLQTRPIHNELLNIDLLKSIFYIQKENISIKKIDISKVKFENFLTPISFAFWIMDDGHTDNNAIFLNTQSFQKDEVNFLIEVLKINFNIEARLRKVSNKEQYRIFIPANFTETIKEIVLPHMASSMIYKLNIK